jgi:rfaE bifunctional protein nucleotidyltransferase chain/domain
MTMKLDPTNWRTVKILEADRAADVAARLRSEGKRLVTTNGSFDLLHVGHLDQLEEARKQGDLLFVGINADEAVRSAKGSGRPLLPERARAAMLAALACVDYVVIMRGSYAEEPMRSLLETVQPQIHVNGPDYGPPETWTEWPVMQRFGTAGHTIRYRNEISTSALVEKIRRVAAG